MTKQHNDVKRQLLADYSQGEAFLKKSDPVMRKLIKRHGPCAIVSSPYRPFHTLAISIIGQQLSRKAADSIEQRVSQLASIPFRHTKFVKISLESLQSAGLSARKATCLRELATRISQKRLNFNALKQCDNEMAISLLTDVPGIGKWTAEMFLIFGLNRLNVLALDDTGLHRSARLLYGEDVSLESISELWTPYCSIASWYLWKHLDTSSHRGQ